MNPKIIISLLAATILILFLSFKLTGLFVQQFSIPATVSVNPVYEFVLDIDIISKNTLPNSALDTIIKLNKSGEQGEIEVMLSYSIVSPNKEKIETFSDINKIDIDNYLEVNAKVIVPDLKPGKYLLNVTASHPQAKLVSDNDVFFVRKTLKGFFESILELFGIRLKI